MHKLASLAGMIIDYYDDPAFWKTPEAQLLVNKDVLLSPDRVGILEDSKFAVKIAGAVNIKRAFPIYNKTSTKLSAEYLTDNAAHLPVEAVEEAADNIKKAAAQFGVDLNDFAPEPRASVGIPFNALATMENTLLSSLSSLDPLDRLENCTEFVKKASAAGHDVRDPRLLSYVARDTFGDRIEEGIKQRDSFIKAAGDEYQEGVWDNMTEKMAQNYNPEYVMSALFIMDKLADLAQHYDNSLLDPIKTVFGITKEAYADDELVAGVTMKKRKTVKQIEILEAVNNMDSGDFSGDQESYQLFMRNPLYMYEKGPKLIKKLVDNKIEHLRKINFNKYK